MTSKAGERKNETNRGNQLRPDRRANLEIPDRLAVADLERENNLQFRLLPFAKKGVPFWADVFVDLR